MENQGATEVLPREVTRSHLCLKNHNVVWKMEHSGDCSVYPGELW